MGITKSPDRVASPKPTSTGEIAAAAFACFDRGVAPDEVLTELVLPVDTVEYLWRTWARLRGVMLLSAEAGQALREALHSGRPIVNGSDIVAALRQFGERPFKPCPRCKSAAREYCTTCPAREARRAGASAKKRLDRKGHARPSHVVAPTPVYGGVEAADTLTNVGDGFTEAPAPHSERGEGPP